LKELSFLRIAPLVVVSFDDIDHSSKSAFYAIGRPTAKINIFRPLDAYKAMIEKYL
jgi:hypothetical protein